MIALYAVAHACLLRRLAMASAAIVEEQQRDVQAALEAAITTARDELVASLG
jgi:hypothetical protein